MNARLWSKQHPQSFLRRAQRAPPWSGPARARRRKRRAMPLRPGNWMIYLMRHRNRRTESRRRSIACRSICESCRRSCSRQTSLCPPHAADHVARHRRLRSSLHAGCAGRSDIPCDWARGTQRHDAGRREPRRGGKVRSSSSALAVNACRSIRGRPSGANMCAISVSEKPADCPNAIRASRSSTPASNRRRKPLRPTDAIRPFSS